MHELGIATAVLDAVREETTRHPGMRAREVCLRIGSLAGVDPESLRFGFEALVQGSDLDPLALRIEERARRHTCMQCGVEFEVVNYDSLCPSCGSGQTVCTSGEELDIAYLEMEDA
jgi:hydrogenase nickel incorporation protein HypA/HybF